MSRKNSANDDVHISHQWAKSPKNSLKECDFVNSALKIQCHVHSKYSVMLSKIHLPQTAFSEILPTGSCVHYVHIRMLEGPTTSSFLTLQYQNFTSLVPKSKYSKYCIKLYPNLILSPNWPRYLNIWKFECHHLNITIF